MKLKIFISLFFLNTLNTLFAQEYKSPDIIAYIEKYKDIAIAEMKRSKIPASITMAQGILESGFGKSYLSLQTNNHFGIKCHETWTGKTFKYTDDAPNECFRVYEDPKQSYKDHSDFLVNRSRYANLFTLDIYDYKGWAYGLKNAGYATNPKYPDLLIKYIETYNLDQLDKGNYKSEDLIAENNKEDKTIKKLEPYDTQLHKNENNSSSNINDITKKLNKKVVLYNKLKAVKVFSHDDLADVAKAFNLSIKELLKYNDLDNVSIRLNSQYIYLEPKNKKAKHKRYIIRKEDNMWKISQLYGIQLDALLKLNLMKKGEEAKLGETIYLKKPAKKTPQLKTTVNTKLLETPNKEQPASKEEVKNTSTKTSKDTVYQNPQKYKTSVDENTVLNWEDGRKMVENSPIKPFPEKTNQENSAAANNNIGTTEQQPVPIQYNKEPNQNTTEHLVEKGDTLYNISKKYGITIAELTEWNNIQDGIIKLGTYLKIKK